MSHTKTIKINQTGFTVLELIIAISIILIIAAVTASGFQNYRNYQQYQLFVTDIRNSLNEARVKTLGSLDGNTYGVYVGTSTVQFFSGSVPVVGSAANYIISFPTSMSATSSFSHGLWYMSFRRLTGLGSATGDITITDNRTGDATTLSITDTGIIE